ncbi:MAG: hypothetical protein ACRDDA_12845 [Aeromonas sp.]
MKCPAAFLWAIPLPVDQVFKAPSSPTRAEDLAYTIDVLRFFDRRRRQRRRRRRRRSGIVHIGVCGGKRDRVSEGF